MTTELPAIDHEDISPGIRSVVLWLRENGFDAIDGGDPAEPDSDFDVAHVLIQVHPREVMSEADRLYHLIFRRDPALFKQATDHEGDVWTNGLSIHAEYAPAAFTGTIELVGPALISGWKPKLLS